MTRAPSQRPGYFDRLYAADPDPWNFATSPYEDAKYARTVAALERALEGRRAASALEVGCSIGVLTARLAPLCEELLAVDVAPAALEAARARCADLPQVRFAVSTLPRSAPAGRFDAVILSEVLYYFDRDEVAATLATLRARMVPGAVAVLVHWLGPTPDYPLTGDQAATEALRVWRDASVIQAEREADYRLDVLRFPAG